MSRIGPGGDNAKSNVFTIERKEPKTQRQRLYSTYVSLSLTRSVSNLNLKKHLEVITGKITEKPRVNSIKRPQSAKPLYQRPQASNTSLYTTSSSAIGNRGRPVSALIRNHENFGVCTSLLPPI